RRVRPARDARAPQRLGAHARGPLRGGARSEQARQRPHPRRSHVAAAKEARERRRRDRDRVGDRLPPRRRGRRRMKLRARLALTLLALIIPFGAALAFAQATWERRALEDRIYGRTVAFMDAGGRERCEEDPAR